MQVPPSHIMLNIGPSFSRVLLSQKTKLTSSLRGKRKSVLQQLLRRGSDVVSEELEIHNVSCGA